MSEPTSVFTFEGLITRIAREAGIAYYGSAGDEKAMPPIDIHDLELCKELANDGIKQFIADAPVTGWRWKRRIMSVSITGTRVTGTADAANGTSITDATLITTYTTNDEINDWYIYILTGTGIGSYAQITAYNATSGKCTVADWLDQYGNAGGTDPAVNSTFAITPVETVAGDIARYPLPENFGGEIAGPIEYEKNSSHSAPIEWRDESFIRARRSVTVQTSYPNYAAIRPLEPVTNAMDPKRRYELILDPQPSATEVLEFPYILTFNKLDMETGKATSGGNTTIADTARTEGDDYFNDWVCTIISGTGKGSYATVTDFANSGGSFTVADWLKADGTAGGTNPGANSIYIVQPANNLHPAGARFDQAIKSACLAEAEERIEDIAGGFVGKYNQKDLMVAHQADARNAPRGLGTMNRQRDTRYYRGRDHRHRYWSDVTYN